MDGTGWIGLGGSATGDGVSAGSLEASSPSLAMDGTGSPVVGWTGGTPDTEVYLRRWNPDDEETTTSADSDEGGGGGDAGAPRMAPSFRSLCR